MSENVETCGCATTARHAAVGRALRLEWLTLAWNVVEGAVAIAAAVHAGSTALLGFGIDSAVESASGLVLLWRLYAERRGECGTRIEAIEHRARRLVAVSLFLLAAIVAWEAGEALYTNERPLASPVGIGLTSLSLVTMYTLSRAKRRLALELGSRALEADASQTSACFWLSLVTLTGITLNASFGWWWADPVAALAMTWFIVSEGREAWRGESCAC